MNVRNTSIDKASDPRSTIQYKISKWPCPVTSSRLSTWDDTSSFRDHYIDTDYDLSKVMFVCTANDLRSIPGPLQDRLEILELSSYTEPEKLEIASRHLIPKQIVKGTL